MNRRTLLRSVLGFLTLGLPKKRAEPAAEPLTYQGVPLERYAYRWAAEGWTPADIVSVGDALWFIGPDRVMVMENGVWRSFTTHAVCNPPSETHWLSRRP